MRITCKNIAAVSALFLCNAAAFGVGSYPEIVNYCQADGSYIKVRIFGDEYNHHYCDLEGNLLMPAADGSLVAADNDFKSLLSLRRVQPAPRSSEYTKYPTTGKQKVLIILAEFQNKRFSYSGDDFRNMLREPGYSYLGAAGSAYDYFVENSAGRFVPDFEVFGPVTLPNNMEYYGSDGDANAHLMVVDACKQLDSEINFSDYDRDGDGWVDNVYVFYAGYGEADGGGVNSIWPHSSNVYGKGERLMLDGVNIGSYSCSNELIGGTQRIVGIGTFCHEFSHVLGLPDVYSTNDNSAFTPYYYSLMDHGNYNGDGRCPCNLTAYERYFLGWCEPRELDANGSVRLAPLTENIAYRLSLPGYDEEYYLLENRVKQGWDAQLPGEGMLIWHIDYSRDVWNRNAVNNDEARQRIDLIEADGIETLRSSAGDVFPGGGVNNFAAFKDHTGSVYNHSLSNIRHEAQNILFDFNTASSFPASAQNLAANEIEDDSFLLEWDAVPDADSYLISVATTEEGRIRQLSEYTLNESNTNSLLISGLEPETEYSAVVRSIKGVSASEATAPLKVTTAEPGIRYFAPVALEASEITATGFTANWNEMQQADSYLLDVFTLTEEASDKDVVPFASPFALPEGWTSSTTSAMSVNGYYGEAAPSLRFSQNAELLETPDYGKDIQGLSFWMRGYKAAADSRLVLSGLEAGSWKELAEITDINNNLGSIWEWIPAAGEKAPSALRLTYYGPSGASVCVDDVTVSFGLSEVKKKVLDKHSMGSATSFAVNGLEPGKDYSYVVYGVKGERLSLPSEEIAVKTASEGSAVSEIETEGYDNEKVSIFTVDGRMINSLDNAPSGVYLIRRGNKTNKIIK